MEIHSYTKRIWSRDVYEGVNKGRDLANDTHFDSQIVIDIVPKTRYQRAELRIGRREFTRSEAAADLCQLLH
jgi:hypothetical protein